MHSRGGVGVSCTYLNWVLTQSLTLDKLSRLGVKLFDGARNGEPLGQGEAWKLWSASLAVWGTSCFSMLLGDTTPNVMVLR